MTTTPMTSGVQRQQTGATPFPVPERSRSPYRFAMRTLDAMLLCALGATLLHQAAGVPEWLRTCDVTIASLQAGGMLAATVRQARLGL